jgi:hypothetical protein
MSGESDATERGGAGWTKFFNLRCNMEINLNSSFPLLAADQADVIRIFLELMSEGDRNGHVREVRKTNQSLEPRNSPEDSLFPNEPLDLE